MNTRGTASPERVPDVGGGSSSPPAPSIRQRLGKPYINKKHLDFVRQQPCMVCGGPSIAHHLRKPWRGIVGASRKAGDENAIPLCPAHHDAGHPGSLHHNGNEEAWAFEHFGHVAALRAEAERLWLASPYFEALDSEGKD